MNRVTRESSGRSSFCRNAGHWAKIVARWLVVILLIVTPLLWGGRHPMARGVAGLLASAAFLFWAVGVLLRGRWAPQSARGLGFLLPVLGLFFLQCSPDFFALFPVERIQQFWQSAAQFVDVGPARFAVVAHEQVTGIEVVAIGAILAWLIPQLFARGERWLLLVSGIIAAGSITAIAGLVQLFGNLDWFLWLPKTAERMASAGFPNRDHFAQFCSMGFFTTLGLLAAFWQAPKGSRLKELLAQARSPKAVLLLLAVLATAELLAILFSYCRASILLTLTGLAFFGAIGTIARGKRSFSSVFITIMAVLIIGSFYGLDLVMDRVEFALSGVDPSALTRQEIWKTTLSVIGLSPWFGSGWEAVRALANTFDTSYAPGYIINAAHNDWLELFAMVGIPLGCLIVLGGILLYGKVLKALFVAARGHSSFFLLALGLFMGLSMTLIHEGVEYGLRQPANLFLFIALALALSAVLKRMEGESSVEAHRPVLNVISTGGLTLLACGAVALIQPFWSAFTVGIAQAKLETISKFAATNVDVNDRVVRDGRKEAAERVLAVDSKNPVALAALAETVFQKADADRKTVLAAVMTKVCDRPVSERQVDRPIQAECLKLALPSVSSEARKSLSQAFYTASKAALQLATVSPVQGLAFSMAAGAMSNASFWEAKVEPEKGNELQKRALQLHDEALSLYPTHVAVLSRAVQAYAFAATTSLDAKEKERNIAMFLESSQRLLVEQPGDARWILPLAGALVKQGDIARVVPEAIYGQELYAQWLMKEGLWEESLSVLNKMEELNNNRLDEEKPWTMGGVAYLKREKRSKDVVARDCGLLRLKALENLGRSEEAETVREKLQSVQKSLNDENIERADALIAQGEWILAEEVLKKMPDDPRVAEKLNKIHYIIDSNSK